MADVDLYLYVRKALCINPRIVGVVEALPFDKDLILAPVFSSSYNPLNSEIVSFHFYKFIFVEGPFDDFIPSVVRQDIEGYLKIPLHLMDFEDFLTCLFVITS